LAVGIASDQLHASLVYLDRVARDRACDRHVMTLVARESIRVLDGQHFLVAVSKQRHLCTSRHAFLGTIAVFFVRTLGPPPCVATPAAYGIIRSSKGRRAPQHQTQRSK